MISWQNAVGEGQGNGGIRPTRLRRPSLEEVKNMVGLTWGQRERGEPGLLSGLMAWESLIYRPREISLVCRD